MSAVEQAVELVADALAAHVLMPCGESRPILRRWAQCEGCGWAGPSRAHWHEIEPDHRAHVAAEIVKALGLVEEFAACRDDMVPSMDGVRRQRLVQPTVSRARDALGILARRHSGARNPAIETRLVTPWREVTP